MKIKPAPLVVNANAEVVYPSSRTQTASLAENDWISICCPGNQLLYNDNPLNATCVTVSCIGNPSFAWDQETVDFNLLKCQNLPENTIRYTHRTCSNGGQEIEIGYDLGHNVSVPQINICFDTVNLSPIYSHYRLTKNIGYRDSKVPRKFFEEDGLYSTSINLDDLYNRNMERQTINNLLDINSDSEQYIKRNGELFVNRGHLTAKGDFVYGFQQLATFHYVNSAPQWASFNGGNWNELEISVRDYANSRDVDLDVYTGIHGITTLPNSLNGRQTELFLHTSNGRNLLPVPQYFWKVILNPLTREGIAVIGVNNPYDINLSDDVICEDVSDSITWFNNKLKRQKRNIAMGYIYACEVSDFQKVVRSLPELPAQSLLL